MNKTVKRAAIAAAVVTLGAAPALAHHSGAMFGGPVVTFQNVRVVEFQYVNPHSWLIVDVTNEDGTTTRWGFEAEGPSTLLRSGVRRSDFEPGDIIPVICGRSMTDGRPAAAWRGPGDTPKGVTEEEANGLTEVPANGCDVAASNETGAPPAAGDQPAAAPAAAAG